MGTLKTTNIQSISGSGTVTLGVSGETFTVPSGVTISGGLAMTPYFYGELAADQTVTRGVTTKITGMTSGEIDTNTAFDGTTFTVPSGQAGNYFISVTIQANFDSIGNDGERVRAMIYKNGGLSKMNVYYEQAAETREVSVNTNTLLALSATDTIELYVSARDSNSGDPVIAQDSTSIFGYKIIGA